MAVPHLLQVVQSNRTKYKLFVTGRYDLLRADDTDLSWNNLIVANIAVDLVPTASLQLVSDLSTTAKKHCIKCLNNSFVI